MGLSLVGSGEPPVPPVMKRLQQLPLLTPLALTLGAIIGDDGIAFAPISPSPLHALLAVLAGAALGGAGFCVVFPLRRQIMTPGPAPSPRNPASSFFFFVRSARLSSAPRSCSPAPAFSS